MSQESVFSLEEPPIEDEIRKRAHEPYLERQRECGGPLDDWLEAEAGLLLRNERLYEKKEDSIVSEGFGRALIVTRRTKENIP